MDTGAEVTVISEKVYDMLEKTKLEKSYTEHPSNHLKYWDSSQEDWCTENVHT